jgi:multidrug efflux pump
MDRTLTIRASVRDVERSLMISISLVILVVFVFLRSVRATLIPSVAVPVSLIGTFGVMYLCHYSIDNLSLMALTISTGFVVDDAIVVIENITRYLEQGMTPMQAALKGSSEIGFTVLSISISLVAVFIPLLLMSGIIGRLFREFAVVLSVAIMVSLGISLTTTPMMCSRLLKHLREEEHGTAYRVSERAFKFVLRGYERSLGWVLEHPGPTLAVLGIIVALNIFLFWIVPWGLFPQQDNGIVSGGIQGAQDTSFQAMQAATGRIVNVVKTDPAVANVMAFTGGGGATNGGFIFMGLKPREQRDASSSQVVDRLRPKLLSVSGANTFLQAGQDLSIGGRRASAQYQYTIQSDNIQDLIQWGPVLLLQMRKLPMLTDANTDQQNSGLQAMLTYDRKTMSRLGITPQMVDNSLYEAFGQAQVSTMYTGINQYHVVLEVAPKFWQSPVSLNDVYIRAAQGRIVPLGAIAHYEPSTAPLAVNHQGQYPSVTISFNLAPGVALSEATAAILTMEQKIGMPNSIHGMFSGTLQAFQATKASEPYLVLLAIVAVYIVLGILYESYIHPLTIISTLPSAGVGAVLALMIFHKEMTIIALIGVILLIGIVKKNAILMIDFALAAERIDGKSPRDAIFQACILRFRPILMTTMAAIFGATPLAFGRGTGSELRNPLGIAIIGGLILSQMLTLYTTPVVYLSLDRLRVKWLRSHGKLEQQRQLESFG